MVKNTFMQLLVILTALVSFSAEADAAVVVNGTFDATYPTWNRISDRSDGLGGYVDSANDALPYEVLEIRTTAVGDTLIAAIQNSTQFDSFLALYSSFNPATPQTNILAADDDSGGYPHAQLTKSGLAANTSYYLIITSYAQGADPVYPLYGSYNLSLGGSFTVVPKGTTTSLSASPVTVAPGQNIILTATLTKASGSAIPTGTVTFKEGSTVLGTGTLNGVSQASLTLSSLPVGTHSITASYSGETKYAASVSGSLTVTVIQPPSVTGISPSSGSSTGGTSVTITGTDLLGASSVKFGISAAIGYTIDSATRITAVSPAGVAGLIADVTVTTLVGTSAVSSADQFTYTQDQAKNNTTGTSYLSLVTALSSALSGAEIRAFDSQFDGTFILDKGLTLKGGYDATFLVKGSTPTTLNGTLTVTNGNSTVETVLVKGKLAVKGGSLRVKDVKAMP